MARPLRIEYPNAWYHVMNRGSQRRQIYLNDADRFGFLSSIRRSALRHRIEIHAYALMGNHFHLLVRTPDPNLSDAMQHIGATYAQSHNFRHSTDGPLFRGRYKSLLVDDDAYLTELVRYIHQNPVKAGACESAAEYRWSSHAEYMGIRGASDFLVTGAVLEMFGGDRARLHSFVRAPRTRRGQALEDLIEGRRAVVANDARLSELLGEQPRSIETDPDYRRLHQAPSIDDVETHVAGLLAIDRSTLRRSGSGIRNDALGLVLALARRHGAATLKELAERYGYPNYFGPSSVVRRFEARAERDPKIALQLASMDQPLERTA